MLTEPVDIIKASDMDYSSWDVRMAALGLSSIICHVLFVYMLHQMLP